MVSCCKKQQRDDFIKKFGQQEFEKVALEDQTWNKLKDLPIPEYFSYLFSHFIKLWSFCSIDFNGNKIFTPRQILDYEEFLGIHFSYYERMILMDMKASAFNAIYQLNEEKED